MNDDYYISVPFTSRLVDKSLLEEILYELESINGKYVVIEKEDMLELDFNILIGKIKMMIGVS